VRIAVAPDGTPWVVNAHNRIYRRRVNRWEELPGSATDVGVGADGVAWVIGLPHNPEVGGGPIFRWNGSSWDNAGGAGVSIAVSPEGIPWVTNSNFKIYRRV
jgi:hypothetical protein